MTILFKNVIFKNKKCHVLVKNQKISKISPTILPAEKVVDCNFGLLLPPFNDPHIHIDSALSVGKPRYNVSGSLFEGIEIWREYKKKMTKEDFLARTNQLFAMYVENGVQNIRGHIDISDVNLEIIKWANYQKEKWQEKLNIQIAAFPQDGLLSFKNSKSNLNKAIEIGVDVIGAIPHYEFSAQLGFESIDYILQLAKKHNLLVDVHCDEIDDPQSRFLEYLATQTYFLAMQEKVTASHTTAFSRYNDAYVRKLWRILKASKLNFIANPLINVHLGGRFDQSNPGRGITRVKELLAHNINVAYGHDDVQDPWYPLGTANMLQVLFMGIHLNHLTGQEQINNSLDLITLHSAKLMQLKNYGIYEDAEANFIIMHQSNPYDVIRHIDKVQYNVKAGKIIYHSLKK